MQSGSPWHRGTMVYTVYILRSASSGAYYIGHSSNVERRVGYHNRGLSRATAGKGPWEMVYSEEYKTRCEACRRERRLKSWKSRSAIARLIAEHDDR